MSASQQKNVARQPCTSIGAIARNPTERATRSIDRSLRLIPTMSSAEEARKR